MPGRGELRCSQTCPALSLARDAGVWRARLGSRGAAGVLSLPPLGDLLWLLKGQPQVGKGRGVLLDLQGWREGGCLCGHRPDLCLLKARGLSSAELGCSLPEAAQPGSAGCVPAAGCTQVCGPHCGSSACGLGEHSAALEIPFTVVRHGISLLLNRDLISQEGLLRSGVVSGLEQNG